MFWRAESRFLIVEETLPEPEASAVSKGLEQLATNVSKMVFVGPPLLEGGEEEVGSCGRAEEE